MTKHFQVAEWKIAEWEQTYSPLNVRQELEHMQEWLEANPRRRKKNYNRFLVNWLNKAFASIVTAQVERRLYARVGENREQFQATSEQQAEAARLRAKYPELGG